MNFIKRGWLSLTRRKSKAIILFAVIFILGNVMAGAVSIRQATGNVEEVIKKQLGSTSRIDLDYKELDKQMTEGGELKIDELSRELINQIGESPYVKYYDYNLHVPMGSDMKPFEAEKKDGNVINIGGGSEFTMTGVQYNEILDFKENKGKLVDGRTFTEGEIKDKSRVAIVSKKFAELNNLKVDDQIVYKNEIYDYSKEMREDTEPVASRDVVLKIVGIFEPVAVEAKKGEKDESGNSQMDFSNTIYQNTFYTPNGVASEENQFTNEELKKVLPPEMLADQGENLSPVYVLKDPDMTEAFKEEVTPLLPKLYKLNSSTDQYDSIAAPIKSMEKLSTYVLIAAVGASLLIVSLVVLLFLRDRKHEFGIYLSLGERRPRVVGQIVFEVMVIACVSLSLSVISGNFLASGISESMIQNQIEAKANEDTNGGMVAMAFGPGMNDSSNVTEDDVTEAYRVQLTPAYIASFMALSLTTILGATIVPMIYLIRLNPKKIML